MMRDTKGNVPIACCKTTGIELTACGSDKRGETATKFLPLKVKTIPVTYKCWGCGSSVVRQEVMDYQGPGRECWNIRPDCQEKAKEQQREHGNTAPGKPKTLPQISAEPPIETREELAKVAKVSHDTVARAYELSNRLGSLPFNHHQIAMAYFRHSIMSKVLQVEDAEIMFGVHLAWNSKPIYRNRCRLCRQTSLADAYRLNSVSKLGARCKMIERAARG